MSRAEKFYWISSLVACLLSLVLVSLAFAAGPTAVYTIEPCRAADTRFSGGPIPATGARHFNVRGPLTNQGGATQCGIPAQATAVFVNFTVVGPSASGYLIAYAYNAAIPITSVVNFGTGQTIGGGGLLSLCVPTPGMLTSTSRPLRKAQATLPASGVMAPHMTLPPLGCAADFTVIPSATTNLIVDVTGYVLPLVTTAPPAPPPVVPPPPVTPPNPLDFSWFKIVAPTWKASQGPMPIQIGAMIDDRAPQLNYTGTCTLGMMSPLHGAVIEVYDSGLQRLPGLQTTAFVNGGWTGWVVIKTATGKTQSVGLSCFDTVRGVGGNSNTFEWVVP